MKLQQIKLLSKMLSLGVFTVTFLNSQDVYAVKVTNKSNKERSAGIKKNQEIKKKERKKAKYHEKKAKEHNKKADIANEKEKEFKKQPKRKWSVNESSSREDDSFHPHSR